MITVDIVFAGTTLDASTSYILIPDEYPSLESIPTTQYVQGNDGILEAEVRKSKAHGVQIKRQLVKHNILKLHYSEVGVLKKYAGISERP